MNSGLQQALSEKLVEKEWEEMNYDERTQKLMEVVSQLLNKVSVQDRQIERLNREIREHQHDAEGKPFTKEYLDSRGIEKAYYNEVGPHINRNPFNSKKLKAIHSMEDGPSSNY